MALTIQGRARPPAALRCAALVVALALAAPARASQQPQHPPQPRILIGLIPEMNIFRQKTRFKLLGEYLSRRMGVPVEFTMLSRYGNILESFQADRMDGAFFGSFTGALAIEKLAVVPLARPVNLDGSSTYRGYLFVRKDGRIKRVEDLRGKRMAFVERATTAGYLFPLARLREAGIASPDGFFSDYFFTGSHDAAIRAVLDGTADAGAAKHSVYDRVRAEDPRVARELAVIAESPAVPSNGLCVRKDLAPELQDGLRRALLGLADDPAGPAILKQFGALRFIRTTADDYRPVAALAAQAGIRLETYQYRNE